LNPFWHKQCNGTGVMPSLVVSMVLSPLAPPFVRVLMMASYAVVLRSTQFYYSDPFAFVISDAWPMP
jgi:hypothetical protein